MFSEEADLGPMAFYSPELIKRINRNYTLKISDKAWRRSSVPLGLINVDLREWGE